MKILYTVAVSNLPAEEFDRAKRICLDFGGVYLAASVGGSTKGRLRWPASYAFADQASAEKAESAIANTQK